MITMRMLLVSAMLTSAALMPALRAGSCCPSTPAAAPDCVLPGASVYHQEGAWVDQDNSPRTLADFAGSPVLISMVFTHCGYACPRTVEDIREVRAALPPGIRERVRIVLASFDVARDTPERLREWAEIHDFDAGWTLLHGDETTVRELAVLLDIAYQAQPDGSFAHANRILMLDTNGVPVAAVDGLGASPAPIVEAAARLRLPAAVARSR